MKNFAKKLICGILVFIVIMYGVACAAHKAARADKRNAMPTTANEICETTAAAAGDYSEYPADANTDYEIMEGVDVVSNSPDPDSPSALPGGNMLIRTVSMTIATENFDDLAQLIRTNVSTYGGYFENMYISGTGTVNDYKRGTYVIRVPAENLDALTAALDGQGTLISSSETTEDVTLDYVDIQSHLSALRTEQDSLMALLEEADDLDTIVQLENYLADIRYEIEYYESQARTMDNLVTYATLTINLEEVVTEEPPVEIDEVREETLKTRVSKAFSESMSKVKAESKDLLVSFAGSLPIMTARLIVLGFFFLIGFGAYKIIKKRKAKKAALAKASESSSEKS